MRDFSQRFKQGEEVIDFLGFNHVVIVKPDPKDKERFIVQRRDGFQYSASSYDLGNT